MSSYRLRRAGEGDVPGLIALRREAERWLAARGIEQWTSRWGQVGAEKLARATRQHRAWVVDSPAGHVAATITLGGPDEDLWKIPEDGPALYLYKIIVARSDAGRGLGGALLDWAADAAHQHGYPVTRLDIWPGNRQLGQYYERHGYRRVRVADVPGRDTGALYQRPAAPLTAAARACLGL